MRITSFALSLLVIVLTGCAPPAPTSSSRDAGAAQDGGASTLDDAGVEGDGGGADQGWTWLPVEGSRCASGATAGIGLNVSTTSDDLFIFMQGGGACWNQGTCVPSLLRYGPICHYGENICLYDGPGGTKPMSSHVTHPDPYPADGGGVFPSELAMISSVRVFDRDDEDNPFRDATFVFVPYCTGDLHTGDAVREFAYKYDAFGAEQQYTFHFAGATNMERYLEELAALRPGAARVWLTGASAGGYGATFHLERVMRHFPSAEVSLLADSSPFVDTAQHWETWRDTWNMQLPEDCASCGDGFNDVMAHLVATYTEQRIGLLAFDSDRVIRFFFHGGTGPEAALSPPASPYTTELSELQAIYDTQPHAAYFIVPGEEHVMWAGYGTVKPDGSHTPARLGPDGETDLKEWIDAWATGASSWTSLR